MLHKSLISIVIPVFNEAESIVESVRRLENLRVNLADIVDIEILFVDDGSNDNTLNLLSNAANKYKNIKVLSLSRNFGHQIAVTAGIDKAKGDYVAIIDGDLQDPPELIFEMYELCLQGFDVVYGKRKTRNGESYFKKITAHLFYRFLNRMSQVEIPEDTGDFRIMSRRVVDQLNTMRERHRFLRGMIPWIGYSSIAFEYDRDRRYAGVTKYPIGKMMHFAFNAVLSFSSKPLALAIRLGILTLSIGLFGAVILLALKLFTTQVVPGLAAILISIVFFSGVQIFLIGVIGQYIARIFEESKGRPLYFIKDAINF